MARVVAPDQKPTAGWRRRLYEVIFESESPTGRAFDLALIVLIIASVAAVILESVAVVRVRHGETLVAAEWFFTLLFTLE